MAMAKGEIVDGVFFWNLSKDVGRSCPNIIDDSELVRYGYHCMKVNIASTPRMTEELRVALSDMKTRGGYANDLQRVIDADQQRRGTTLDGKVSVAKIAVVHKTMYDGIHSWTVWNLHLNMIVALRHQFPRIDLDPASGADISVTVRRCMMIDTAR
jgi:hypothetical protein